MSHFVKETTPLLEDELESKECMSMTVVTTNPTPTLTTNSNASAAPKERLASLDQYRGFVILCSLIVPLLGDLNAAPDVFKHKHNFFSIAGSCEAILERVLFFLDSWVATIDITDRPTGVHNSIDRSTSSMVTASAWTASYPEVSY
jgi:hypothetical protein